jgi:hypothetical protein
MNAKDVVKTNVYSEAHGSSCISKDPLNGNWIRRVQIMALTVEIVSGTMNVSTALPYINKTARHSWNMQSHQDKMQKRSPS